MIRRPPRSTQSRSSAASDVYKRQLGSRLGDGHGTACYTGKRDVEETRAVGEDAVKVPACEGGAQAIADEHVAATAELGDDPVLVGQVTVGQSRLVDLVLGAARREAGRTARIVGDGVIGGKNAGIITGKQDKGAVDVGDAEPGGRSRPEGRRRPRVGHPGA